MTFFWSSWITVLSIMCWGGILGVLLMVLKYKPEVEDDGTTGHEYDGIREYDKALPKWWLVIFFGSIIWGVAYWVFFPAIFPSKWEGIATVEVDGETVPWTSHNELNSELESNNKVFTDNFEQNILAKANASGATKSLASQSEMQATLRRSETPPADLQTKMRLFRDRFGVPYTEEDIEGAPDAVLGATELDALVAYLQQLGTAMEGQR